MSAASGTSGIVVQREAKAVLVERTRPRRVAPEASLLECRHVARRSVKRMLRRAGGGDREDPPSGHCVGARGGAGDGVRACLEGASVVPTNGGVAGTRRAVGGMARKGFRSGFSAGAGVQRSGWLRAGEPGAQGAGIATSSAGDAGSLPRDGAGCWGRDFGRLAGQAERAHACVPGMAAPSTWRTNDGTKHAQHLGVVARRVHVGLEQGMSSVHALGMPLLQGGAGDAGGGGGPGSGGVSGP